MARTTARSTLKPVTRREGRVQAAHRSRSFGSVDDQGEAEGAGEAEVVWSSSLRP